MIIKREKEKQLKSASGQKKISEEDAEGEGAKGQELLLASERAF